MIEKEKILFGLIKPFPKKYRFWFIIFLAFYALFLFYINFFLQQNDVTAIVLTFVQLPLVIVLSLPSLFPEKEIFQLFIQFNDKELLYKPSYLKAAKTVNYSEIQSIEIKPTKILIDTKKENIELSFALMGYQSGKKIKAKFEELKKQLAN